MREGQSDHGMSDGGYFTYSRHPQPYLLGLQEKARMSFLLFSGNMPRNPSSEFDTLIPGLNSGVAVRTVRAEDNPRETPRPLKPLSERGARGITRNLVQNLMFMENNRGQDSLFVPDIPAEVFKRLSR